MPVTKLTWYKKPAYQSPNLLVRKPMGKTVITPKVKTKKKYILSKEPSNGIGVGY